jgi:alpha-methylacyl-CoA racemase
VPKVGSGSRTGPLRDMLVLQLGGIGTVPFAGMLLAEMGAQVICIDRPGGEAMTSTGGPRDLVNRGKRSVVLDLKKPGAVAVVCTLARHATAVIEGWRPGVAERLGVAPEQLREQNPALVYGRVTGWGQHGPLAYQVGHDIDYIAVAGALHAIGPPDGPPQIPLNLVGDIGGGALYLTLGVLAATLEARVTGIGRTVDAAIVDGVTSMLAITYAMLAGGDWADRRAANIADGAAPCYSVYETADGRHVAVGALEPAFYRAFVETIGADVDPARQWDRSSWPSDRAQFTRLLGSQTQAEWIDRFSGTDSCVAPVLSLRAAAEHPHIRTRRTLVHKNGVLQPAPAPRFSGLSAELLDSPVALGADTVSVLQQFGVPGIEELLDSGTAVGPQI